jgi:hypothetical protein
VQGGCGAGEGDPGGGCGVWADAGGVLSGDAGGEVLGGWGVLEGVCV